MEIAYFFYLSVKAASSSILSLDIEALLHVYLTKCRGADMCNREMHVHLLRVSLG
jgi:hypothetical protein